MGTRSSSGTKRAVHTRRPASYYRVAGVDLRSEMDRLCRLPAFGGETGPLRRRPPTLTVRRASRRPRSLLGFAIPEEWRISVTAFPGQRRGDAEETLVHELVHLFVGASPGISLAWAQVQGNDGAGDARGLRGWRREAERQLSRRLRRCPRADPFPSADKAVADTPPRPARPDRIRGPRSWTRQSLSSPPEARHCPRRRRSRARCPCEG